MLAGIEQKLTSLIADGLVARAHLSVLQAPGPVPALGTGKGAVLISLADVAASGSFERGRVAFNGTQSRRILPIEFTADVAFFMRPADATANARAGARETMLDDMALTFHQLAQDTVGNGAAFTVADPDPGFKVLSFLLEKAEIQRDGGPDALSGTLHYRGNAQIWPPGVVQNEGQIRAVDTVIVPLPLDISAKETVVQVGQRATILVRSLGGQRLMAADPRQTQRLQIAVTVLSDAAPAQRGSISSGVAGAETGFRIIDLTPPETAIAYEAPVANVTRPRTEYVAIHLASPDRTRGVFLGSAAVRLEPAA